MPARRDLERQQRVGEVCVVGGGQLAARLVVQAQDRVEVRLQVVDLVLEAIAPDLERDALAFLGLEGIPVDIFELADPARDDGRQGQLLGRAGRSLARSSASATTGSSTTTTRPTLEAPWGVATRTSRGPSGQSAATSSLARTTGVGPPAAARRRASWSGRARPSRL